MAKCDLIQVASTCLHTHSCVQLPSSQLHFSRTSRIEMQFLLERALQALCDFMMLDKITFFCTYALKTYKLDQRLRSFMPPAQLSWTCQACNLYGVSRLLAQLLHACADFLTFSPSDPMLSTVTLLLCSDLISLCYQSRESPSPTLSADLDSHTAKLY